MTKQTRIFPTPVAAVAIVLPLLLVLSARQALAEDAGHGSDTTLVQKIDAILAEPRLQTGFQGICIQSLRDNTTLYERNADQVFQPASNNKLLTSGAALSLLGSDYAYHTKLFSSGSLDRHGTLHGDLILQGAGDPILTPEDLALLAQQAVKAGIRRISGALRYDDTLFDDQRLGDLWAWDDEPYYYSAQISALNLNENLVRVEVKPGKAAAEPVQVAITPTDRFTTLINKAVTGPVGGRSSIYVDRIRGQNTITITGSLPLDIAAGDIPRVPVTIEDPSRFTDVVFAEELKQAGIRIKGREVQPGKTPTEATLIAEHISPPLSTILKRLNKPSDNLIAECLLKTLGAVKKGQGSSAAGAQVARDWFASIGMDVSHLLQADGSGLSRVNYVSPHNLVKLLTYLNGQPTFPIFYDSLPIAGVDGSLTNRLKGTAAANNCHAKTGYISHASSLSGYIHTRAGEPLVFSILMNNHLATNGTCIAAQDKIVDLLANYTRATP